MKHIIKLLKIFILPKVHRYADQYDKQSGAENAV